MMSSVYAWIYIQAYNLKLLLEGLGRLYSIQEIEPGQLKEIFLPAYHYCSDSVSELHWEVRFPKQSQKEHEDF